MSTEAIMHTMLRRRLLSFFLAWRSRIIDCFFLCLLRIRSQGFVCWWWPTGTPEWSLQNPNSGKPMCSLATEEPVGLEKYVGVIHIIILRGSLLLRSTSHFHIALLMFFKSIHSLSHLTSCCFPRSWTQRVLGANSVGRRERSRWHYRRNCLRSL